MIDIQHLRSNLDAVAASLATRGYVFDRDAFLVLEAERKDIQTRTQELQAARNAHAKKIGQAKAKGEDVTVAMAEAAGINQQLGELEGRVSAVQERMRLFLAVIPNLPHESVPPGRSAEDNVELRRWGEPRKLGFPPKDHVDIGEALGQLDFATATKISGARFVLMTAGVARLHRAIAQFMLDVHTQEHGYTEVYVPYIVNAQSMYGTGQLPKFEQDLFIVPRGEEKWYLIPTAEVPVTNIVRDEIVPLERMPLKFVCHTPCFRSEAGSYGKDTRGMIRQHQFDKVELVRIVQTGELLSRARGAYVACRDDPEEARAALPDRGAVHRRHGCGRGQDLRHRGMAARPGRLPRDLLMLELRGLSRRAACRRATATKRASRSSCIRSTARG